MIDNYGEKKATDLNEYYDAFNDDYGQPIQAPNTKSESYLNSQNMLTELQQEIRREE